MQTSGKYVAVLGLLAFVAMAPVLPTLGPQKSSANTAGKASIPLHVVSSRALPHLPQCTSDQLTRIQDQIVNDHKFWLRIHKNKQYPWRPWFAGQTSCPQHSWWSQQYQNQTWRQETYRNENTEKPTSNSLHAIFLGCNKALDAVHTLHRLSQDPAIDLADWVEETGYNQGGVCGSPSGSADSSSPNNNNHNQIIPTQVHCVEAMPTNYRVIAKAAKNLHWENRLRHYHLAVNDRSGQISFPNSNEEGQENLGIATCRTKPWKCQKVEMLTLDRLVQKYIVNNNNENANGEENKATLPNTDDIPWIDFLSIDTEGYDWPVLQGSSRTLSRVRYLEFEHHHYGVWPQHHLQSVIQWLAASGSTLVFDDYDTLLPQRTPFICYYAGRSRLWRITHCWVDAYNTKTWSNVACVNARDPAMEDVRQRMEALFLETLREETHHFKA